MINSIKKEKNKKKYRNILGIKVEKIENLSLTMQLVIITIVSLAISTISLLVFVPAVLKPYYVENLYSYLKQPANFIQLDDKKIEKNITYVIVTNTGAKITSANFNQMFKDATIEEIIAHATADKGTFKYETKTYYYVWGGNEKNKNLIITDNSQLKQQEEKLLSIMFPSVLITIIITTTFLFVWSQYVLNKIKILKKQAEFMTVYEKQEEQIINEPYFVIDDELNSLSNAMIKTKEALRQKEEYKNMMFQNMSHELKTPISVIKSYTEAVKDNVITEQESIKIISEEIDNLSSQVNTLLQISKIDYLKDEKKSQEVEIISIIKECVKTHKKIRKDLIFNVNIVDDEKTIIYKGETELYKTVFDNILGNFVRYAKSEININISNNSIQFINDGENIDKNIIDNIFLPYVKGKGGESGLGLSIVKRIIDAFEYKIVVKNLSNGVMFEISK